VLDKGDIVDGYRIDAVVGEGPVAVVYAATHLALQRRVALKLFRRDVGTAPRTAHTTQRRWSAIDHPHLLRVLETRVTEGRWVNAATSYLVMPLVEGPNLKQLIAAGGPGVDRTMRILRQIAGALDAVHAASAVHGVVKPQNVLVARGDQAYLSDLGILPYYEAVESDVPRIVDYLSPEQIRGLRPRPASDVYALAAVLYECLTGIVPFPRGSATEVLSAHLEELPPAVSERRPDLPLALDEIVASGMAKDPDRRPGGAGKFVRMAEAALAGRVPRRVDTRRTGRLRRRRREAASASLPSRLRHAARSGVVPASAFERAAHLPLPARPPPVPALRASVEHSRRRPEAYSDGAPMSRGAGAPLKWTAVALAALGGLAVTVKWLLGLVLEPSAAAPESTSDVVECTVFAPPSAAPGETILVQVFVHLSEDGDDARAIALEMDTTARRRAFRTLSSLVERGSRFDFELRMPGLTIDDPVASMVWHRRAEAVQFGVHVPEEARPGSVIGTLDVSLDSAPLGHVKFKLSVGAAAADLESEPQGESARRYEYAFVSYASPDRPAVMERLQTLSAVRVGYFADVVDLEPGDRWLRKLELGIDRCDLFLLFWSSEAKRSEWVRREVRYALARKAGDDLSPPEIRPVIVEGPPIVEPWEELAHLHFNDRLLYFMNPTG
jgi:hypothetical protein